jgi:hypothetical protein
MGSRQLRTKRGKGRTRKGGLVEAYLPTSVTVFLFLPHRG